MVFPLRRYFSLSAKKAAQWGYFIRKQSSTVRAKGADERELIGLTATLPFDDRFNQQASVDDLSPRLIEEFLKEVGSDLAEEVTSEPIETIGRQMNIVSGPSEMVFPKNVGLLFFNDTPERFFPATQIDVVWFPDGPGGDRFEEKEFKGPLGRMTREALDYIQRNYLKETVVKHPDRAEAERYWNFPYAAVEEALVNAVYHRSYEIREPVEVRITREELVILSFPGPDRSIRMEALRRGKAVSRRYRNRRIGELLKELELTEGRSTGIPKMLRVMSENGSPAPEFETDEDRTHYLVRLPVHTKADWQDLAEDLAKKTEPPKVTPQVEGLSGQVTGQVTGQVEAWVRNVLEACKNKPLKSIDLQEITEIKHRETFQRNYLDRLLGEELLEHTEPDKLRSPTQKYRLTAKGRQLLESL